MRTYVLLLIALLAPVTAAPRQAQPQPRRAKAAYSIRISAAQDLIKSGAPVTIRSVVTNVSGEKIWALSLGGDVTYRVRDTLGFPVRRTRPGLRPVSDSRLMAARNITSWRGVWFPLQPGQVVVDDFVISDFYDLTRPGRYTIQALRPDPDGLGVVKSNTIRVTVTP